MIYTELLENRQALELAIGTEEVTAVPSLPRRSAWDAYGTALLQIYGDLLVPVVSAYDAVASAVMILKSHQAAVADAMVNIRFWENRLWELRADTPEFTRKYTTDGLQQATKHHDKAKELKAEALTNLSNWFPKIDEGLRALSTKASVAAS